MIISPNYYWSNRTAQWVPYCKSHVLCGFFLSLSMMVASGFPYFYAVILIVLVDITQQEWIKCNSFFIAPSGAHGTDYSPHCFHKVIFSIRIKPRAMKLGKSTIFLALPVTYCGCFLMGKIAINGSYLIETSWKQFLLVFFSLSMLILWE